MKFGYVRAFRQEKNYGFITRQDGKEDIWFQTSQVKQALAKDITRDAVVAFDPVLQGKSGKRNSGSVTALSYSTLYWIYFTDPTLSGGAVTYLASTSKPDTLNSTGNLFVGSVQTPAAFGANTTGNGDGGSSSNQTGATNVQSLATTSATNSGTVTGLSTTGATATANAGTPTSSASFQYFNPPFNNNSAASRVLSFFYSFILTAATGNYTVTYGDGTLSGTIVSGSAAISTTTTFALPAGINVANLTITMTSNYSTGTSARLTISLLKLLVSS